ncbi:MAG: flavin reductase family protein [Thermodesulfobacteriota bacterium]
MKDAAAFAGIFWHNSPVVIVTSALKGKINGQVAVTVVTSSIVPNKPRLMVGIWKGNYTHGFIIKNKTFNLHLLKKEQIELVKNFGFYSGRDKNKFMGIDYFNGVNGCPVIHNVHSYAECKVINAMDGGDMTVFLVDVTFGDVFRGDYWMTLYDFYNTAPPDWIEEYNKKLQKSINYSISIIDNINHERFKY